jgi:F-type H+-transporting ATPase subunit a
MGRVTTHSARRFATRAAAALLVCGLFAVLVRAANEPTGDHAAAAKKDAAHHDEIELEAKDPLGHVLDSSHIELFESFGPSHFDVALFHYGKNNEYAFPTKFMLLEVIAAGLVCAVYIPMAKRLQSGELPQGGWLNAFEVLLTFVRDELARPALGHDADKFVPFLWTMFLFILFNNILGLIPFFGAATGSIYVTLALAICVFFAIHGSGVASMGFGHYAKSQWPHFDLGFAGFFLELGVFLIEWMGIIVRNLVLAVRLFANMFAGHVVLATILIFIYTAANLSPGLWGSITVLSVLGQVALSLLELFVAFLQAYIFTFLTSLFIGMALYPAH